MARKHILNQDGTPNWDTIAGFKERLDGHDSSINNNVSALAESMSQLNDIAIDVKNPPAPLIGAKGDGVTDDTTAIQNILNSLIGKTGIVLLPGYRVFVISNTLVIPETIELKGTLSTRYGRSGANIPSTILKWNGATNGTMLKFQENGGTVVYGAKIKDISFDGNSVTGVTALDISNSKFGVFEHCNFTRVANGIYMNGNYYNTIQRNVFEYFTGIGINFDSSVRFSNDNTILENYFSFTNPNTIGIRIDGANSIKIAFNRFEGYATGIQPIYIQGSNTQDTAISFNRMEHLWDIRLSQTPIYMITISNTNGAPRITKITGNQLFPEEIDTTGATYYAFNYAILDQGFGTVCDDYIDDNYIPNGSLQLYNGSIPIWKSDTSSYVASFDNIENAVKLITTGTVTKYPKFYNIIDAKAFRNKNLIVSTMFKCSNIATIPKIEVMAYKGGDGTVSNLGTFQSGNNVTYPLTAYKSNDYMLLVSTFAVPSDCDNIFINVNPNGTGATTPADNTIWVKYIALAERRTFKTNPNKDLIVGNIRMVYPTTARPTGTKGLMIIDSTLNKPIWFDGTSWRDSTGATV